MRRWAFEVKHDGFRFIAPRDGDRVRVFSRHGKDWTDRVPLIVEAMLALPVTSATIDGEGVVVDERGVTDFERLRSALAGRSGSRGRVPVRLRSTRARRRGPAPASMGNPAGDVDRAVA
jgi:bifunctional non-homologous end joining protein LigD